MKVANLGVIFLLELAVLVAVGYWGFTRDVVTPLTWLLGLGVPSVMIALWWLFGAPDAPYKTHGALRVGFELIWFGAAALALFLADRYAWAIAFAVVCVLSKTLAVIWHQ